jgi:uncharacterized protein (TIGR04141 family)
VARQHLTIFLLRESVGRPIDALRSLRPGERLLTRELTDNAGFGGTLFLKKPTPKEPAWVSFIRPYVSSLPKMEARRSSAVLILQAAERWFAITFGHGRLLLDPARVEHDFGLKVVVNSVKPDALRSVDAQSLEEVSLISSFRIGRAVPVSTFGLDLELELVRALSGYLDDDSFAAKVTGSTALALDAELSLPSIPEKCEEALVRSQADAYKTQFRWIDNVQRVADPERARELEGDLDALLGAGTTESFMLALPRVVPDEQASRFRYSTSDTEYDDLRWDDYVATVAGGGISVAAMKDQQVTTISADGEDSDHWSVYSCLAVEIEHNDEIYVLTGGEWFRVARSIADRARAFVESLEVGAPTFPPYEAADATEGGYNRRLAASVGTGAACLDAKNVRASGAQDPIEFADVLVAAPPRIVHVKRHSRSSTLSHLFQQGRLSAELLQIDEGFRAAVAAKIAEVAPTFTSPISASTNFRPADFEIVFAVITPPAAGTRHFLPFFSQLSCERVGRELLARGYGVKLARVDTT